MEKATRMQWYRCRCGLLRVLDAQCETCAPPIAAPTWALGVERALRSAEPVALGVLPGVAIVMLVVSVGAWLVTR